MSCTRQKTTTLKFNESKSTSDREKYLTAKYPQQQMQMIRKRLKIEFWVDDQLNFLYNVQDEDHNQCSENLIDSLLDLNNDFERHRYLLEKLSNVKQSHSTTLAFIDELISRLKLLY